MVERTVAEKTFDLLFTPEEIRHQQHAQRETVILAIGSETVTLEPVQEEDEP